MGNNSLLVRIPSCATINQLTSLQRAPPGDIGQAAEVAGAFGRKADGHDVLTVLHRAVEHQHGHVVAVGLRRETKVGMQLHLGHREQLV